jgi:hypothetical protein
VKLVGLGFLLVILWSLPKEFSNLLISSSEVVSEFDEEHVLTVTSSFL